jgi:lipopolysaccharide/colanic/teichoic acid biosynthesis glycosyltransferase
LAVEISPESFLVTVCLTNNTMRKEHWNLSKVSKLFVFQLFAMGACLGVVSFGAPQSETLLQVSKERLLIYSILYGISCLVAGEIIGLFANNHRNLIWKKFVLSLISASMGSLGLILAVWTIEFEFVGRFAILKMILFTGLSCFLFLAFLNRLNQGNPWKVLVHLFEEDAKKIMTNFEAIEDRIEWISPMVNSENDNLIDFCKDNQVDIVISDEHNTDFDVIALLGSGVRVFSVTALWETFSQKIPHSEINQDWLAKLDLRQRDPIVRRVKRIMDIWIASLGLVLAFPLLFLAGIAIILESGFPLFFKQRRTGYLGRPYLLYKLRTMKPDAEKSGATWATKQDHRVTYVGRLLRRIRIDEIPQFWNVIKGEMSIVGPRPERPELEEQIVQKLPYWNCRYLLKPGLTGWAQIKYQYASDLDTSEEKLAYDLFYVKNASFFLDLEIILSTLRSLTKGSR